jgi:hypothetical protein
VRLCGEQCHHLFADDDVTHALIDLIDTGDGANVEDFVEKFLLVVRETAQVDLEEKSWVVSGHF